MPVETQSLQSYFPTQWSRLIMKDSTQRAYQSLFSSLDNEYSIQKVYPIKEQVFNALNLVSPNYVKVVIVGQDPYHGPGQAHGLSFSVPNGVKIPPSLRNIFKELAEDLKCSIPTSGNLTKWAEQGVLLLNSSLTVLPSKPGSHAKLGWQELTDQIIQELSNQMESVVFILWGNHAIMKSSLIDSSKHLILTSVHPSPLSARKGFFGSKHFSKTNAYLVSSGKSPIDWCLDQPNLFTAI